MTPIINTRFRFYDYFPHISPLQLRNYFGIEYSDQVAIRCGIQRILSTTREQLMYRHYMQRINAHDENPNVEPFDKEFYKEFKTEAMMAFRKIENWRFLDDMLRRARPIDSYDSQHRDYKVKAALGFNASELISNNGQSQEKNAIVSLFNHDLNVLCGEELEFMINSK